MATKNVSSKNVSSKNTTVKLLAANEYTLAILTDLPSSVNFGATVYANASAYAHTFNVPWSISGIDITAFSSVTTGTHLSYAISGAALPAQLSWNGETTNTNQFNFAIGITNLDGTSFPTSIDEIVSFTLTSSGILSAGAAGTVHSGISQTGESTIYAQGSALSALYTTFVVTVSTPTSIAYGATVNAPASAYVTGFQPLWNGLSSVNVGSFSVSSNNTQLTYAISAGQTLPAALAWNGIATPVLPFNLVITNNGSDNNITGKVTVTAYSSGVALSADGGIRTMQPITSYATSPYSIIALGLPPSSITGFAAIPYAGYTELTWVNPTADIDFAAANLRKSATTAVTTSAIGTLVYSGTAQTYTDTNAVGLSAFYYGIYSSDIDGESSTVQSLSVLGIETQPYPPSPDPSLNVLDPLSQNNETVFSRLCRLGEEALI